MSTSGAVRRAAAEISRDRPSQDAIAAWVESAVVASVTAGAAADGNALATVTWRGSDHDAAYLAGYAPTAGDVVLVLVQPPNCLAIFGKIIGTPIA